MLDRPKSKLLSSPYFVLQTYTNDIKHLKLLRKSEDRCFYDCIVVACFTYFLNWLFKDGDIELIFLRYSLIRTL